jgi:hypothetical protein
MKRGGGGRPFCHFRGHCMIAWLIDFLAKSYAAPAAILLSASVALVSMWVARITQRRIARQQQTIQMLMGSLWDKDFIDHWREFNEIVRDSKKFLENHERANTIRELRKTGADAALSEPERLKNEAAEKNLAIVRQCLNHYELVSIGIREGIYDEKIYRRWYNQSFIRDWQSTRIVVEQFRRDIVKDGGFARADRLFAEFDELARLWKAGEVKTPKLRSIPLGGGRKMTFRLSR